MKNLNTLVWLIFILNCFLNITPSFSQANLPVLRGPYLGQKLPGNTPELFAPAITPAIERKGCPAFSPDGNLFIFDGLTTSGGKFFIMKQKNGIWSKPEIAPFSSQYPEGHVILSPDGKKLYFSSQRPVIKENKEARDWNIWVIDKIPSGWSQPYPLEYPINTDLVEIYASVTNDGSLYFFKMPENKWDKADIYRSVQVNGKYSNVENMGKPISSAYEDVDPFIAPNASYIIICSKKPGGYGDHDLYIAYKKNKEWINPKNLGNVINSEHKEVCPVVTPDGKFFFFLSNRSGEYKTYWVSAQFIDKLK